MDVATHLQHLQTAGVELADAAAHVSLDAPVPSCPQWQLRDLLQHIGGVHRWAAMHVRDRPTEIIRRPHEELVGGWPADDALLDWYLAGHEALVHELRTAPQDLACATFLTATSPLAMWARRQAHETTIHRVDAELVTGSVSDIDTALAADGIDELLAAFITRPGRGWRRAEPAVLLVDPTDADDAWEVRVSDGDVVTRARTAGEVRDAATDAAAIAHVRGPAGALYLLLWNRAERHDLADHGQLEVAGDIGLLDEWRGEVQVVLR